MKKKVGLSLYFAVAEIPPNPTPWSDHGLGHDPVPKWDTFPAFWDNFPAFGTFFRLVGTSGDMSGHSGGNGDIFVGTLG